MLRGTYLSNYRITENYNLAQVAQDYDFEKMTSSISFDSTIASLAWLKKQAVLAGAWDGKVHLISINVIGQATRAAGLTHGGPVLGLAAKGNHVMSAGPAEGGKVKFFDISAGKCVATSVHEGASCAVFIDNELITGGWDGYLRMWSLSGESNRTEHLGERVYGILGCK